MTAPYPAPTTPLPWTYDSAPDSLGHDDAIYLVRAANAFPHLIAALEMMLEEAAMHDTGRMKARKALAIARGEVSP